MTFWISVGVGSSWKGPEIGIWVRLYSLAKYAKASWNVTKYLVLTFGLDVMARIWELRVSSLALYIWAFWVKYWLSAGSALIKP